MLMLAVQLAAERCDMWRAQRGTWDVGSTVRLYEAVRPYFKYPSKIWYAGTTTSVGTQCTIFTLNTTKHSQWICPRRLVYTELWGASDDVFGRAKPKKIDGEPA